MPTTDLESRVAESAGQPPDRAAPSDPPDPETSTARPAHVTGPWAERGRRLVRTRPVPYLVYLVAALVVTGRLWVDPNRRVLSANYTDHALFQWFVAQGAWVVTHPGNPFFTRQTNFPDGVNLAANTATYGITVPLAPVTLLFGPAVAYVLMVVLAFAGTAAAWYWVLSRTLLPNRLAAFVAGAMCGFAPGLVTHASGQPNIMSQFVIAFLVYRVVRLVEPGRLRWLRNGLLLAPFVVWQVFVNEEILLFTGLAGAVFTLVAALSRPRLALRYARPVIGGLAVAGVVSLAVLAYPLWFQFTGPQHYQGLPFEPSLFSTDVANFFSFSRESVAGSGGYRPRYVLSAVEENSFFGWPLLLLVAALVGWLWRSVVVRAAAVTAIVFGSLSLGAHISVRGRHLDIPGPFLLAERLPLLDLVTPTRFALVMMPMFALIVGLGIQRAAAWSGGQEPDRVVRRQAWRAVWTVTVLAALVPIAPTPLTTYDRPPVPAFFTSGQWREYVPDGYSLVTVPLPINYVPEPLWWQASNGMQPAMPGGYFLGPTSPDDPTAIFGAPPRPTTDLLFRVYSTGVVPTITDQDRAAARADLAYWHAAAVILAPGQAEGALRTTVVDLLGFQPVLVGGVWLWRVAP